MANLKPGWKRVKLGQVAINSTVATKDWASDRFERYIIGKHIPDDGSPIRTWNPVGDAEFGSRIRTIFRAGDVICTTRGPKLKVAVPNFDGLSAHTNFILRTKDANVLLQPLLEAVVRSEGFQKHLRKHFRGSTNLFVNWSDAAEYEFALPPLEEQRRIADLATAAWTTIAALQDAAFAAATTYRSLSLDLMRPKPGWSTLPLEQLVDPNAPICYGIVQLGEARSSGVPVLRTQNLNGDFEDLYFASPEIDNAYKRSRVQGGDVLIAIQGASTGKIGIVPRSFNGNINRHVARVRLGKLMSTDYFLHLWMSPLFARYATSNAVGSTKPELTIGALRALKVPLPPLTKQREISNTLAAACGAQSSLSARANDARAFVRRAIEPLGGRP